MEARHRRRNQQGHAITEVALMAPWLFFLFVGAFDFGFYAYAMISVENAARAAAAATSGSKAGAGNQVLACGYAREELKAMPNQALFPAGCNGAPLKVTADSFNDSEGKLASRVRVTYDTVSLIPIPGVLAGQMTINRTVQMRVFGD